MKTVELNQKKCIGCAYCEAVAPNVFVMDYKKGKVELIEAAKKKKTQNATIFPDDLEAINAAIKTANAPKM